MFKKGKPNKSRSSNFWGQKFLHRKVELLDTVRRCSAKMLKKIFQLGRGV